MSLLTPHAAAVLLSWYRRSKRILPWRDTGNPEDVWISEIMLQQTRVEAVKNYFLRFRATLPDAAAIAACPDDALMKLWEGLGYYSRARNLKKCAAVLVQDYKGRLPADYRALLSLPGIGAYTAGAIASIAYEIPVPAVDGNVLRVWARLTGCSNDIASPETKKRFTDEIQALISQCIKEAAPCPCCSEACADAIPQRTSPSVPSEEAFSVSDFNQALMELGAVVCVPNGTPLCAQCPLRADCTACRTGATDSLPVRSPKRPRRIEKRTLLIIRDGERFLLRKRPDTGLLAGLYEFPGVPGHLDEAEALAAAAKLGIFPLRIRPLPEGKHIFTHIEWHMCAWEIYAAEFPASPAVIPASSMDAHTGITPPAAVNAAKTASAGDSSPTTAPPDILLLAKKEELQQLAIPSAFRTWINWYALKRCALKC
ncbi:MAG: A/G-specific adenine glycosylase [Stomatobaculum sp.]